MLNPGNALPDDSKKPGDKGNDVESGSPPAYPLAEPEDLVVGGSRPRCFWRCRRRCGQWGDRRQAEITRKRRFIRAMKLLLGLGILMILGHFVLVGMKIHRGLRNLQCTTIVPANSTDGLVYSLPLSDIKHVQVHDTLTGGNVHITHDSTVPNGTVKVTLKFNEGAKEGEVYDGCVIRLKHAVGMGLIPREPDGPRADVASLGFHFPSTVSKPTIKLIGEGESRISVKKLRRLIRWWRKHYKREGDSLGGCNM